MSPRSRGSLATRLPPLLFGVVFIGVWQLWVVRYEVEEFVIPRPTDIWASSSSRSTMSATRASSPAPTRSSAWSSALSSASS